MIPVLAAAVLTAPCGLRWNPHMPVEIVTHYRIFRGIECIAEVRHNRALVDLPTDQLSTLTVIAYNEDLASEPSDPITVIPVTPQSSETLTDWKRHKPFFVEAKPNQFFRFEYPAH